ncbi:MAG: hypothetical protein Q4B48_07405 [Syntrophomonadaceae bacterium]|nr:hypothetical protein [Syntrophomonadaceae bacterium]
MNNNWSKGEPVRLSDLIRITPLANEVLHLAEELKMSSKHVLWIVSRIISGEDEREQEKAQQLLDDLFAEDDLELCLDEEQWEEIDAEMMQEDLEQARHRVDVVIAGAGRFSEIGFHAGIEDREDMKYFFDLIMDMVDKLD